jgi:hypothetical protein
VRLKHVVARYPHACMGERTLLSGQEVEPRREEWQNGTLPDPHIYGPQDNRSYLFTQLQLIMTSHRQNLLLLNPRRSLSCVNMSTMTAPLPVPHCGLAPCHGNPPLLLLVPSCRLANRGRKIIRAHQLEHVSYGGQTEWRS